MDYERFVTNKEKVYFLLMLIFSIFCYLVLAISISGIFIALLVGLIAYYTKGIATAQIKQNAIKITDKQFPDIYKKIEKYSMDLNLAKVPKAYIVESGGLLGAFTTRFSMGDMLILHSDIVELAYEQGENAINFIIAHELAHLKRKHLQKDIWIICARIIVPLYLAYSRACETTCDNIATALVPEADLEGIILLLAGKKLYKKIDTKELLKTTQDEQGYFAWLAEIYSTHPTLANRLLNIRRMKAYMQI